MSDPVKKIIYLLDQPLDKRLFTLLGVETLINNGFEVEIWDLTPFFHKLFFKRIVTDGPVVFANCKSFDNKVDIINSLSGLNPGTLVNSFLSFQVQTYFIYRILSKKRIRYCVVQMISFPAPPPPPVGARLDYARSVVKRIASLKLTHVILGLSNKILLKYYFLFGIRPADMAILSGERSCEIDRDPIATTTHLIWAHAWDYDTYLRVRKNETPPGQAEGVFLDEYFPLHTDLDYLGISSPIGADEYFGNIRSFFDHLEMKYNVRIVIAAHPRSDYSDPTKYFGTREVIKGQTAQLVRESSFVLAHDSTSINYAVLFRKPIIFMTMDKIQKCDAGRLTTGLVIESIARSLKKIPININSLPNFDWNAELIVDMASYTRYQNDFIKKSGSPEIPLWEIYAQSVREIYS